MDIVTDRKEVYGGCLNDKCMRY